MKPSHRYSYMCWGAKTLKELRAIVLKHYDWFDNRFVRKYW